MLYGAEVCALGAGEQAGHIFEHGKFGILLMGGTPHFSNDANGLEEQAASVAVVKPGLLAGDADVLAVMNRDPFGDVAVVVFHLDVVDRSPAGGFNAPHPVPVLSFRNGNRSLMRTVELTGIYGMLPADPFLNDAGGRALLPEDCPGHVGQRAFAQQADPVGQLPAYAGCAELFPVAVSIEISAQQGFAQRIICPIDPRRQALVHCVPAEVGQQPFDQRRVLSAQLIAGSLAKDCDARKNSVHSLQQQGRFLLIGADDDLVVPLPLRPLGALLVSDPAVRQPAAAEIHQIRIDTGRRIKPCAHISHLGNGKRCDHTRNRPLQTLHIPGLLPLLSSEVERMLGRASQPIVISLHEDCRRVSVADCSDLFPVVAMRQTAVANSDIFDGLVAGVCKNQRTRREAGRAEGQYVHGRNLIAVNRCDAPQMPHLRESAGGHGDGVGLDLAGEHGRNAVLRPSQLKGTAAGKQRAQRHHTGASGSSNTSGSLAG